MKIKSNRIIATILAIILVIVSAGATYLWFYDSRDAVKGSGKAALIEIFTCLTEPIKFENVLPGEPIPWNDNVFFYRGNRNAIIEIKLTGDVILKASSEVHKDWVKLDPNKIISDYILDATRYHMTEKRVNEVLTLEGTGRGSGDGIVLLKSPSRPNTYYLHAEVEGKIDPIITGYNLVHLVRLKINGELGGMYKGSPSRQFEQQCEFSKTGITLKAVQVTPEAIDDVLGSDALSDVQYFVDQGVIVPGSEWQYIG